MAENTLKDGIPYLVEKSESMKPYWEGLNDGKLMTTRCTSCENKHFPPTPQLCRNCFSSNIEWVELPRHGIITTWTNVTAPPEGFFGSYILASVKVDDLNKNILGRYLGSDPQSGQKVNIEFEKINDQSILVFTKI